MTVIPFANTVKARPVLHLSFARKGLEPPVAPVSKPAETAIATALVYCEGNFGKIDGKTANGLVRHSEKYEITSIIDSTQAGRDAGELLDGKANEIPVFASLDQALAGSSRKPDYFIYGMAPATGMLSPKERKIVLAALGHGMNVVNGLHEFLGDDPEFVAAGAAGNAMIIDVRKPRPKNDLRLFSGAIHDVTCPRIAVLGTDCAIGKRTTASILTRALIARGVRAVMVSTGQTGLMQGGRYGVALDAVPSQFCCGELEATIVDAWKGDDPDVIIVEGQGALSHPAFCTSAFILRGSAPQGVILQHAPHRENRCDFEHMKMPEPKSEIDLIEAFSDTRVIGLTINHENMNDAEIGAAISAYEADLKIPVTDALARPDDRLVDMVFSSFPELERKHTASIQ
ncbi:DUF1611 domain-containing protein [Labrenzia sp. 011]|uniref:DUF1611 domain-containing protein n=1 Tax=Labrenzia sp. 011 TaxID=2171494 RepID=UPI000D51FAE9|nr:DUF1611 domain-containing protein [Labrenzia sp. 011]PVB62889.1 DUF1611 domain-containing protein [Labrenzia sp. 011]